VKENYIQFYGGFFISSLILTTRAILLFISYPMPRDDMASNYMIIAQIVLCMIMNVIYIGFGYYLKKYVFGMNLFKVVGPDVKLQFLYNVYQVNDTLIMTDLQLLLSTGIVSSKA